MQVSSRQGSSSQLVDRLLVVTVHVSALLGLLATGAAQAAIAPGKGESGLQADYDGNGEVALMVFDDAAKISYTLDLGMHMKDLRIYGQQDYGFQRFWAIDPAVDAPWVSFLSQVSASNLRWSVVATDTVGGNSIGGINLFMTVQQGQENLVSSLTNTKLSEGVAGSKSGLYFAQVNISGTHSVGGSNSYQGNGSSVIAEADNKAGYFGVGSMWLSTTISSSASGKAPFDISNEVGKSSWFYQLSRSGGPGSNASLTVNVDEFDNLSHDAYWGFIRVPDNADSIYKGKYLLSYTLESVAPTATTAAGQLRMSFTDYSAGFASKLLVETPLGEFAGYRPSSLVVPSPVPEPATWGLLGLGLLVIGFKTRQKQPRA